MPIHCLHLPLLLAVATAGAQTSGTLHDAHRAANVGTAGVQSDPTDEAKTELQAGADLTRHGALQKAIPRLIAAQRAGADPYATGVNLGICYLGLGRYHEAIAVLTGLRSSGYNTGTVNSLLSQAYLGDRQAPAAMDAFLRAAALTPKDEKLYAFLADACTDHREYAMGLRVVETGLRELPASPRLHYERALFLARLDRLEEARPEFDTAAKLAPDSYIATLALVQRDLYDDKFAEATSLLHQAIDAGHRDYQTLSLLGTVLMQAGAVPGQMQFAEAQAALEESARDQPDYSATQIALGKLCIMEEHFGEAVEHLEHARRLEPGNPAVYINLAHAYRRLGEPEKARRMQAELARQLAAKSNSTPPAQ